LPEAPGRSSGSSARAVGSAGRRKGISLESIAMIVVRLSESAAIVLAVGGSRSNDEARPS
jgi:hypothetical protein